MSDSYKIKTINDLMRLPSDKIFECLAELAIAVRMAQRVSEEVDKPGELIVFNWINDDKTEFTFKLRHPNNDPVEVSVSCKNLNEAG